MTKVTLPKLNQTGKNEWNDVQSNDEAIATVVNGELDHTNLSANSEITGAQLASSAKPIKWYTPKVIATEENRENTAYGTLATKDEITGVVLPENGLILVGYQALWKSSSSLQGRAAIFLGSNILKTGNSLGAPFEQSATHRGTDFDQLTTCGGGLLSPETASTAGTASNVTTGQVLGQFNVDAVSIPSLQWSGGLVPIFAAAGTYNISVQYKVSEFGSVTAKERKLWVMTLGV
jgi:hypothetical protein